MSSDSRDDDRAVALIDALYGSPRPAGSAEQDAELMALDRVRGLFRELPTEDAPPAAMAKILAAAAAQAPRRAAEGGAIGWLRRSWERLVASPALAATASLVLVAGVAGILVARGKGEVVQPSRPSPGRENDRAGASSPAGAPSAAPLLAPPPAGEPSAGEAESVAVGGNGADPAKGDGSGRVGEGKTARRATAGRGVSSSGADKVKSADLGALSSGADKVKSADRGTSPAGGADRAKSADRRTSSAGGASPSPPAEQRAESFADRAPANEKRETARPASAPARAVAAPTPPADDLDEAEAEAPRDSPKSSPSGAGSEVARLHATAVALADRGDCKAARAAIGKIRALDRSYFVAKVAPDPHLARCADAK